MVVDRCCLRPSIHLAQVRVPIDSGWAATDVIKVSDIAIGSGLSLATKYLAFFRCAGLDSRMLSLPSKSLTSSNRASRQLRPARSVQC